MNKVNPEKPTITTITSLSECEDPKEILLTQINNLPGIRFRQLLRLTGLSNGVLAYHLKILENSSQIRVIRQIENKITRYYSVNISIEESDIIGHLRNNVSRQIIRFILEHDLCTFNELVEHLGKAQSTVSWHLKRLKESKIVWVRYGEQHQLYQINKRDLVSSILYKYKENIVDVVVNNYTEIVDEL